MTLLLPRSLVIFNLNLINCYSFVRSENYLFASFTQLFLSLLFISFPNHFTSATRYSITTFVFLFLLTSSSASSFSPAWPVWFLSLSSFAFIFDERTQLVRTTSSVNGVAAVVIHLPSAVNNRIFSILNSSVFLHVKLWKWCLIRIRAHRMRWLWTMWSGVAQNQLKTIWPSRATQVMSSSLGFVGDTTSWPRVKSFVFLTTYKNSLCLTLTHKIEMRLLFGWIRRMCKWVERLHTRRRPERLLDYTRPIVLLHLALVFVQLNHFHSDGTEHSPAVHKYANM